MKGVLRTLRGKAPLILGSIFILAAVGAIWLISRSEPPAEPTLRVVSSEPPPDLAPYRKVFLQGLQALENGDGAAAVAALDSFSFAPRAVEEYRLYYLANANQLLGEQDRARRLLATLWRRSPRMVFRADAGFNLAQLYDAAGDWQAAAEILAHLSVAAEDDTVAAAARIGYAKQRIRAGDPFASLSALRRVVIESPAAPQVAVASVAAGSLTGTNRLQLADLAPRDRLQRVEKLIAAGKPDVALRELEAISGDAPVEHLRLARGRALNRLRRYEDSSAELEPLFGSRYRWAIPALEIAADNHRRLADSIQVEGVRSEKVRERAGTRLVKRKGKKVRVPNYRTVTRQVKFVDAEAREKRNRQEQLLAERLEDLLSLPLTDEARIRTLVQRIELADRNDNMKVVREKLPELTALDPRQDPALQKFWDSAWAAFAARRLDEAESTFDFIRRTYRNPGIQRQATYWYARTLDLRGKEEEAQTVLRSLVQVPFRDLYSMFAEERGIEPPKRNASFEDAPDWHELVLEELPVEMQLAYELTELGAYRDARLEIRVNSAPVNSRWQDALTGQILYYGGSSQAGAVYLRRAFPELSTAEQLKVPRQFLQLYYPLEHRETIEREAKQRDLDPFLVMALIHQESGYDPEARSHVGATGLMQLMPATAAEIGRKLKIPFAEQRRTDPETNIRMGVYYLRQLIGMVGGDWRLALAAYNGGIGNVWKWQKQRGGRAIDEFIESIPFGETRGYVKRITLIRSTYEQLYGGRRESRIASAGRSTDSTN